MPLSAAAEGGIFYGIGKGLVRMVRVWSNLRRTFAEDRILAERVSKSLDFVPLELATEASLAESACVGMAGHFGGK